MKQPVMPPVHAVVINVLQMHALLSFGNEALMFRSMVQWALSSNCRGCVQELKLALSVIIVLLSSTKVRENENKRCV